MMQCFGNASCGFYIFLHSSRTEGWFFLFQIKAFKNRTNDTISKVKPSENGNLIGVGVTILVLIGLTFIFDIEALKSWVINAGVWAPLLFIGLKATTIVIAPLSGSPLYPLVGLLFGFFPGIFFVALGDFLGYTIAFCISRFFGKAFAHRFISKNQTGLLARVVDRIGDGKGFFYASLALGVFPELLAYGAGLSRLPYLKFIFILWPITLVTSTLLVLFGSIINPDSGSFAASVLVPMLFGGVLILVGGTLFLRYMEKDGKDSETT